MNRSNRSIALRDVLSQLYSIGIQSMPLVMVTAVLSGIVTSQQGGYQFTSSIPLYVLGSVVASSVVLELGPVMTAFVLIGRVGARITAELGTMKVSEQIDALHSLGRDPVSVLADAPDHRRHRLDAALGRAGQLHRRLRGHAVGAAQCPVR